MKYRDDDRSTDNSKYTAVQGKKPFGWFSNKYNPAFGWVIYELDKNDTSWLKREGVNVKDVYRVASDKGTSIVKFNFSTGTYAFLDNKYLEDTDEVRFDKAVKAKLIILDK